MILRTLLFLVCSVAALAYPLKTYQQILDIGIFSERGYLIHPDVLTRENIKPRASGPLVIKERKLFNLEKESRLPTTHTLFQGDMLITKKQSQQWKAQDVLRYITSSPATRWPGGVLYYALSNETRSYIPVIQEGIMMWQNSTCLSFIDVTDADQKPQYYISIEKKSGCYSYVGRQTTIPTPQTLSLGTGCDHATLVAHELGHAIGLYHHHSRPDRDSYVKILASNMQRDKLVQYQVYNTGFTYNLTYDYSSIMHYDSTTFSSDGLPTLLPLNVTLEYLLNKRQSPSFRDIALVNRHYGCIDKWIKQCPRHTCLNGGYLGPNCKCVCPTGIFGLHCEEQRSPYYAELPKGCGGFFTEEGSYTTPGFNQRHNLLTCSWWFQSADDTFVPQIIFHGFSLYPRLKSGFCYYEVIELRLDNPYDSTITSCGKEIEPGTTFTALHGDAVIRFYSNYYGAPTGAAFSVKFVPREQQVMDVTPETYFTESFVTEG